MTPSEQSDIEVIECDGYQVWLSPLPSPVADGWCRVCRKLSWQCRGHLMGGCVSTTPRGYCS